MGGNGNPLQGGNAFAGMQQPNQWQFNAQQGGGGLNSGGTDVTPYGAGSNSGSNPMAGGLTGMGAGGSGGGQPYGLPPMPQQGGGLNAGGTDATPYGPGANTGSGGQSLIGGGVGTPYWQQQYQQNPGNVQNMYSPPAANQLGQFYPGQSIWPTPGQGGGGGNPQMPNGGKGNGGGNGISPTASPLGGGLNPNLPQGQMPLNSRGIGGGMSVV
jgi:hypothetical protein